MTWRLFARALSFSLAACIPLLFADAIWGVGIVPKTFGSRLANMHWPFHFGTVTLSTVGALLGFHTLGGQGPSVALAAALGIAFGLVSIVAAPAALIIDGARGCIFWLFVGAAFAAVGAAPFNQPVDPAGRR